MPSLFTEKTTGIKNGFDKTLDGSFRDPRKAKVFFVPEPELKTKTKLSGFRKTIFLDRYSLKDKEGKSLEEYPEQLWERVSKSISQYEKTPALRRKWYNKFYRAMEDYKFVPAGRILSGAGTGYEVTFFNCYVIPDPHDSRGGIMERITQTVEIQARAGGVGFNISSLRPRGSRVKKVNGTSSGPVNWASLFSSANHDVIQQGGSRRGALMIMLHDWHPDVLEFIQVKKDLSKIPGANLSVCISDKFMKAVKENRDWKLIFPDLDDPEYDDVWDGDINKWIGLGKKVDVHKTVKARKVWEMIAEAAWSSAEPGLHFLERSNKQSNTWYFEKLIATNPCGEQPLGAWSVCNLGAMNLSAYVSSDGKFMYDDLSRDAATATRFMDNVVDANFYFYKENLIEQQKIRRIGLGTMGLGDALIKMKIPYGDKSSIAVIDKIYRTIRDSAYVASSEIASEKGPFPEYKRDKFMKGYFIKKLPKNIQNNISKNGIRNAVILTQAPTGTTSLLSGVSSGIEPVYDFEFKRTDRTGERVVYHPLYESWKEAHPNEEKPAYFVCAKDLSPEDHLAVQAKIQEYTDSSISKTVNAPNSYTAEDVKRLYTKAYESGCKGITFFRDGSRAGVLESVETKEKPEIKVEVDPTIERPFKVDGSTYKLRTPVGVAFVTINETEAGEPLEVFINVGKAGSDVAAMAEALGRTISSAFRFKGSVSAKEKAREIVTQLSGIGGRRSVGFGPNKVRSLPDAVAMSLAFHFGFGMNGREEPGQITLMEKVEETGSHVEADICPSCGSNSLVAEEGCVKCYSCGHSEC
ncbi:MAG: Ribonucleoside-diphosphate reductase [Candidatus Woesebacteria bacterium GW2011_GWB1_43_14]|uniref:Vitamin B12-dependent ribonucleotide reductase n=1 Tax=Candidatus Woesebacteria bacterium GW2011_GWB1_43_14 TaxID=1618578 RepID=A0A0G1GJF1_9BACT|nr:MAG: Ribonucleoside-diphosphate reductase [Candidatus Woesebacteria bacterium GW2011_GWC1_42_9]KKS98898.1 MAG: Ribonucleoside-diphosphate reductase [Candidatus Woesebacteria bacterium GW2011_GWB1_43_14]